MSRQKVPLSTLCSAIIDCVNKTAPLSFEKTPYKMLRTSNIRNGRIDTEDVKYVSRETYEKWTRRCQLLPEDIIFTREAPLGEVGMVVEPEGFFLGQRLVLFRTNPEVCYPKYLLYVLQDYEVKNTIVSGGVGSTVTHMRVPECAQIQIPCPPLEIQKRIADTLYTYDTLIENNRKQIKLLEEAARRLYKEWFVDLRFPGHEHTPIVNGIPEGWRRGGLSSIASFVRGKTITQAKTLPGCIPVVAGGLTPAYYHNTANTRPPVITVSASGANAGYVALYHTPIWASDCSFIDSTKSEHLYYLYCLLKEHQAEINNFRKGSAQPHVHPNQINGLQLLVPHMKFIRQFEQSTAALFGKIRTLNTQNELLTEARDRLLPKLMSGEITIK